MKALPTITTAIFLLGAGYALAEDTTSPTTNPSSSGRPSAILNDSECQNVWQNASNATGSTSSGTMSDSSHMTGKATSEQKSDMGSSSGGGSSSGAESTAGLSGSSSGQSSSGPASGARSESTGAGNLSKEQANQYVANFSMVDKDKDGQISQVEFQDGCKNGWVQQTASGNSGASNAH
jgi:hypothetical protein